MKKSLIWFRNDLRTRDNRTLAAATADTQETVGVYFLASSSKTMSRLFLLQSLRSLKEKLEKMNISLVVIELPGSSYDKGFGSGDDAQPKFFFNSQLSVQESSTSLQKRITLMRRRRPFSARNSIPKRFMLFISELFSRRQDYPFQVLSCPTSSQTSEKQLN